MDDKQRIGRRIAEVRGKKGFTQRKLAELAGMRYSMLVSIELGKNSTGIEVLARICKPLGLRVELVEVKD